MTTDHERGIVDFIKKLIEAHIFRTVNNDIEFLLIKRAEGERYPNLWQMVTGSIEPGEKAYQTALREIKEETNLTPVKMWMIPNINSFYSPEEDCISFIPVFAVQVEDISQFKISSEHSDFRWVNKDEAKELLAWPGQKQSVDIIHEYFRNKQNLLELLKIDL